MKKLLLVCSLLTLTNVSFAGRIEKGSIRLEDGSTVVRIEVGQDNSDSRELARRIRRLEEATRDLQNRVYDLEVDGIGRNMWVCKAEAFMNAFYGEGATRGQAERRAVEECQKSYHAMHCDIKSCTNE